MPIDVPVDDGRGGLGPLLEAWQSSGEHTRFDTLLAAARPLIERVASRTLKRHHVADPAAIDDTVSRVLDHLRRLPDGSGGERLVARFAPPAGDNARRGDPGEAYVVWLATERASDVARIHRRSCRRIRCFSDIADTVTNNLPDRAGDRAAAEDSVEAKAASCRRLHDTLALLEPRQRAVIELLLAGKPQAVIARHLGVCGGTVSRLRSKAVASLRRMLAE